MGVNGFVLPQFRLTEKDEPAKTRQDNRNTRQDKTKRKTRQDKARQDRTSLGLADL